MRNINRIEPFLDKLGEAWKKYPDLRFSQLILILLSGYGKDPFYVEDDVWLVVFDAYIKGEDIGKAMRDYMKNNTKRYNLFTQEEFETVSQFKEYVKKEEHDE